tara:strand:+ start:389 stop:721 length:333 start_codon:yes stop_codon:yes gene_type:complete
MRRTKKRVYRRIPNSKKNKRKTRRTKRMKLKIKNLGKKRSYKRSYKRIQYGCSKKNMKGGGPIFQPLTDIGRMSDASSKSFFHSFMGNDSASNEIIASQPTGNDSHFNYN